MHVDGPQFRFYLFHFVFHISIALKCLKVLIQCFHLFVQPKMKWRTEQNDNLVAADVDSFLFRGQLLNGIIVLAKWHFTKREIITGAKNDNN